jgi:hypothetical protein
VFNQQLAAPQILPLFTMPVIEKTLLNIAISRRCSICCFLQLAKVSGREEEEFELISFSHYQI